MPKALRTLVLSKPQLPSGYTAQVELWPTPPEGLRLQNCPMFALQPKPHALQTVVAWAYGQVQSRTLLNAGGAVDVTVPIVVLVSPSVLEFVLRAMRGWPPGLYCAVMGQQSAALAIHLGVPQASIVAPGPASHTPEDADGLLQCLQQQFAAHSATVLLCKGEQGRADLALRLAAWAKRCTTAVCYAQQNVHPAYTDVLQRPEHTALWATSSGALVALHAHWQSSLGLRGDVEVFKRQVPVLATHPKIAQCATDLGFARVHLLATGIQSAYTWLQDHNWINNS